MRLGSTTVIPAQQLNCLVIVLAQTNINLVAQQET